MTRLVSRLWWTMWPWSGDGGSPSHYRPSLPEPGRGHPCCGPPTPPATWPVRCWLLCTSDESHIAQCAALSNTCGWPLALQHRYRVSGPRISTASRSCPCNLLSHAIQHFLIDNRAEHNTTISSFFSIQVLNACIHWIWLWRPGGNTWTFRGEWSSNLHDIICLSTYKYLWHSGGILCW